MRTLSVILLFIYAISNLSAQEYFYENPIFFIDENSVFHEVSPSSEDAILKQFLEQNEAVDIEFNSNPFSNYPLRVKSKDGNWSILKPYYSKENKFNISKIGFKNCDILFPNDELAYLNLFSVSTKDGVKHLAQLNKNLELDIYWDINYDEIYSINFMYESENQDFYHYLDPDHYFIMMKKNNHFGLAYLNVPETKFYQLTGFTFESEKSFDEVIKGLVKSDHEFVDANYLEAIHAVIHKNESTDIALPLSYIYNKKGYLSALKCHNSQTNSWSIATFDRDIQKVNYNKETFAEIKGHRDNGVLVFEVWREGKVGFINEYLIKSTTYNYDDFQFIEIGRESFCALKLNDGWRLYKPKTTEILLESKASTIGGLIEEWLQNE